MCASRLVGIAWWACLLLGCGWSHSALAQGKTDLLLPPSGSLPRGTGNVAPTGQPPGRTQPPIQQVGNNAVPKGEVRARVIARVNGSPILDQEIESAANMQFNEAKKRVPENLWSRLEQELKAKALEDIITDEAIVQDAAIRIPPQSVKKIQEIANKEFDKILRRDKEVVKLKTEEEIKDYMASQGKSIDLMRRSFIRTFLAQQWIRELCRDKADVETTREKLLEYYRANPQDFLKKERVVWQHIYIDVDRYKSVQEARQVAETAWQMLRNAKTEADFNAVVEKYADGTSKVRSGTGEGSLRGEIRPVELERFVFDQPAGGQGPLVETSRGYHLFKVIEHTPEEMLTFEKVCIELRRKLEDRIISTEYNRLAKILRDKAFIEMLND
jgi:parvulin-like peptidyl-prolyl isomerase